MLKLRNNRLYAFNALKAILGCLLIAGVISGCKTKQIVPVTPKKIKRYSVGKVVKLVNENTLHYETLSVKKFSLTFENEGKSTSVRGSYKIRRDSVIQIFAQKLAIPIGKMEVTPDSFRIAYFLDQQVLFGTNDYLNKLTGMELDYSIFQALLTNKLFSFKPENKEKDFREYVCDIEEDMYKISSLRDRKIKRITKKEDRFERFLNRFDENHAIKQDIYIDPDSFVVRKIIYKDLETKRGGIIQFSKFEKVNNQWFPAQMEFNLLGDKKISVTIELSKISIDDENSFGFAVSPKYQRKRLE